MVALLKDSAQGRKSPGLFSFPIQDWAALWECVLVLPGVILTLTPQHGVPGTGRRDDEPITASYSGERQPDM